MDAATVLLLLTWALRILHIYSFESIVFSLLIAVLLALLLSSDFRAAFARWRRLNFSIAGMYIGSVLAFWLVLSPEEYPVKGTSLYLLEGFKLFNNLDVGAYPHYGKLFVAPVFDAEPTISAVFAFFSHGDHFLYYAYGEYWINLLVAPIIPIGSYLFFRRFFSAWLSIAVTVLFCVIALDFKIWSLRGELLAWILGFAFLILLVDFLSSFNSRLLSPRTFLHLTGMGLLFVTLTLMHGIVMLIVSFLSVGLTLRFILAEYLSSACAR